MLGTCSYCVCLRVAQRECCWRAGPRCQGELASTRCGHEPKRGRRRPGPGRAVARPGVTGFGLRAALERSHPHREPAGSVHGAEALQCNGEGVDSAVRGAGSHSSSPAHRPPHCQPPCLQLARIEPLKRCRGQRTFQHLLGQILPLELCLTVTCNGRRTVGVPGGARPG